jgi:peptide/nickel transport system permease protein
MTRAVPRRHPLLGLAVRRILLAIPLLIVVSALTFVLISLSPGDAAREILGADATPEAYAALRERLGLDLPLYAQYWQWASHAVVGDFGTSLFSSESVATSVAVRAPVTLSLAVGALIVSLVVGVAFGVTSAVRRGVLGRVLDAAAVLGWAVPAFWLGAMLVLLFAVRLHWLPAIGYVPITTSPIEWLRSLVLPVAALSLAGVAAVAKQTREAMLDVLGSEYIRVARANGIRRTSLVLRHALRNAAIRIVTILGLLAVGLVGGTVVVESVFALPGIGSLAVQSSLQHDFPLVQGIVVLITLTVVGINLLIDLVYGWVDPRVHVA